MAPVTANDGHNPARQFGETVQPVAAPVQRCSGSIQAYRTPISEQVNINPQIRITGINIGPGATSVAYFVHYGIFGLERNKTGVSHG